MGLYALRFPRSSPMQMVVIVMWMVAFEGLSQDPKYIRDRWFPNPDTSFATPSLASKRGFMGADALVNFLDAEASSAAGWRRETIGHTQKGRPICAVEIGTGPTKVMFIGGIHGNEPAGTEGLCAVIQKLSAGGDWDHFHLDLTVRILPMVNADGMSKGDRYASNGLDLNRDQTKLENPEIQALKRDHAAFAPDVVIDFHEYRPYRADFVDMGDFGVTNGFDAMFLYSGNLNVPAALREANLAFLIEDARRALDGQDRSHSNYIRPSMVRGERRFYKGAASARSSATSFALSSSLSALVEIRGVGLGRKGFERRVETAVILAESFLRSAKVHATEIQNALAMAHVQSAPSGSPIVVSSKRGFATEGIPLIDVQSGEKRVFEEPVYDSNGMSPERTRPRPLGYVLLPDVAHLSEKLEWLGMEVADAGGLHCACETYELVEDALDPEPFEGVHPRVGVAETHKTDLVLPQGARWVNLNQRGAAILPELLEPEAVNGWLRYRVLDPKAGEPYPIVRILETTSK